jgi:hypothetical protein
VAAEEAASLDPSCARCLIVLRPGRKTALPAEQKTSKKKKQEGFFLVFPEVSLDATWLSLQLARLCLTAGGRIEKRQEALLRGETETIEQPLHPRF